MRYAVCLRGLRLLVCLGRALIVEGKPSCGRIEDIDCLIADILCESRFTSVRAGSLPIVFFAASTLFYGFDGAYSQEYSARESVVVGVNK